jgi:glycosyltransferase involved in cell wall biosynthesis
MTASLTVVHLAWEFPPAIAGGLGVHVGSLASAQAGLAGMRVVAVVPGPRGPALPPGSAVGLEVIRAGARPSGADFLRDLERLNGQLFTAAAAAIGRAGGSAVIHAHDWLVAPAALALRELLGVPLCVTFHATEAGRRGGAVRRGALPAVIAGRERRLALAARAVFAPSASTAREAAALGGPTPHVVRCGWPLAGPPPPRRPVPGRILFVGRLAAEKGAATLIRALAALSRQVPTAHLVIAGDGPERPVLERTARDAGVGRRVRFTGWRESAALGRLRAAAAVCVAPSLYEPFGLAALEAVAAGAPLVASRVGGLAEWADGVAVWAEPGDAGSWADALAAALCGAGPPAEAERRRRRLRAWTWRRAAERTAAVYRRVAG